MSESHSTTLHLTGLSCASCVGRAQGALIDAPGVIEASVNLATSKAVIRFDQRLTDADRLAQVVSDAGYPARAEKDTAPAEDVDTALLRTTLIAAALALPVFILEMGGHVIPAFHHWVQQSIGTQTSNLIQFALTSLLLLGPGRIFYAKGIPSLVRGAPDMNALVALGTAAAYGYSVVATFAPDLLPQGTAHVYFEAACVITVLILFGRVLEARAKGRASSAIKSLLRLQPKFARVERDGITVDIPISELRKGDILMIRPGERIPVDAIVLDGHSRVDESMISGEPVPVAKSDGAEIMGGTVNGTGALRAQATRVGEDTVLAQIIRMVEEAQAAKLPIQGLVDRITMWFVPAVLLIAALAIAGWLLWGPAPALPLALVAGVSVLIIACPCAMGLATPTSIMVGTGRAAELGVLFRKGDALQRLQEAQVVAFDKTGTLTEGRPELTDLSVVEGIDRDHVLQLAAAAEARSEHPIASAITRAWTGPLPEVVQFETITGLGLSTRIDGVDVLIGADRLFDRDAIDLGGLRATGQAWAVQGKTPVYMALDGRAAAVLAVADPIKPEAARTIAMLHDMGLQTALISGDNRATAQAVANQLGIDHVSAEVLPDGKVRALEVLRDAHGAVAFVGDGINDAPVLASADVGIAIGTGTDVAIEAADVVLMNGDPNGAVTALDLSRRTMRNIRQNLVWAFGYNILLIPVAAGVLHVFGGPLLSPGLAAGAMAFSSVFVVTNALRLRRLRPAGSPSQGDPAPQPSHEPEASSA
ncbi:heavy metal translocating P-type ATPase [Ruegeria sp. 2205SS24-7]|uniref:heavy metal translocating P-type ATPase n=1 Tax=Ruegeria discodermiae TaxID=3064389 RepID=UPI002741E32A|nr:heavy metal translocating P-type ATPase [Ruegeria sp. 2205SS24-7]MDP5219329.1 heavy metal translocating P-type ATPase [Ruegeria sp. 2205SS24-7]